MSFAFTHLIATWFAGKIYERKKKLSYYTWLLLLLGGILPDGDLLIDWIFKTAIHRTFTHSLVFAVLMFGVIYFMFYNKQERFQYATAMSAGILIHILLDSIFLQGITLLWPSPLFYSFQGGIQALNTANFSFANASKERLLKMVKFAIVDMGIGTLWIFYLGLKKKITF